MKDKIVISLSILVLGVCGYLLCARAFDAPLVFQTEAGETCGCLPAGYAYPSESLCSQVDTDEFHEVITVSSCY